MQILPLRFEQLSYQDEISWPSFGFRNIWKVLWTSLPVQMSKKVCITEKGVADFSPPCARVWQRVGGCLVPLRQTLPPPPGSGPHGLLMVLPVAHHHHHWQHQHHRNHWQHQHHHHHWQHQQQPVSQRNRCQKSY